MRRLATIFSITVPAWETIKNPLQLLHVDLLAFLSSTLMAAYVYSCGPPPKSKRGQACRGNAEGRWVQHLPQGRQSLVDLQGGSRRRAPSTFAILMLPVSSLHALALSRVAPDLRLGLPVLFASPFG